jgi:hypothetical protein
MKIPIKSLVYQKTKISTIAIILMFVLGSLMATTPGINAAVSAQNSYPFVVASPNPVGLGQRVLVLAWVADPTPTAQGAGNIAFATQFRSNYTVIITAPDGTSTTRVTGSTDPSTSFAKNLIGQDVDYEGSAYFTMNATQVGNYTFTFKYGGQTLYTNFPNGTQNWNPVTNAPYDPNLNYTALPATTTYTLTVQQQPVDYNLPTTTSSEYWQNPVNAQNFGWSNYAGNWLMAAWNSTSRVFDNNGAFVPEGTVPNTGHILWTKPMSFGGLIGGTFSTTEYYSGMSYEMYFAPPIIINGRVFYSTIAAGEPQGQGGPFSDLGTTCVDLYTGQTLFTIPNATMSYGQIQNFVGPNQAGGQAYLWSSSGSTATVYDPWSGDIVAKIANMPSGVVTLDSHGSVIIYSLTYNTGLKTYQFSMWNSTQVFSAYQPGGAGTTSAGYSWRPFTTYNGTTLVPLNGTLGVMWTVNGYTPPGFVNGVTPAYTLTPFLQQGGTFSGNDILAYQTIGAQGPTDITSTVPINVTAYNMATGAIDYTTNINPAPNMPSALSGIAAFEDLWEYNGHLYSFNHYTTQWVAYDVKTGSVMWVTPASNNPWSYYGQADSVVEAYGNVIISGFDGYARIYSIANGTEVGTFYAGNSGGFNPYGHYTFYDGMTVCDGKAILLPNEHGSGVEPLYQNLTMSVISATNGSLVWNINGYFEKPALANGILLSHNNYDNQIYAFGKGPTALTVTAPNAGVTEKTSVVIRGTIADISAGSQQAEQSARFPNGVPVVSDADQSAWMEYVYMQQPKPHASGAPVEISVVDSNHNFRVIGTTTSDESGAYSLTWVPDITGNYTITASFAGSQSYYPASAETSFSVDSPAATQPPAPGAPASNTDMYILGSAIAIIIVIIIVGAVIVMMQRKRP